MSQIYDVCVIGAGVNGSAAAYSLSKRNKDVLLLEQYPSPHTRGSSHGQSRIIRCLYQNEFYATVTFDSYPIWRELEKKVNEKLLIQNGMLEVFLPEESSKVLASRNILEKLGVKYDLLTAKEISEKFPLFNVPDDCSGLFEHSGGMVMASKCVASLQKCFVQNGGEFIDGEQVLSITPGAVISIQTNKNCYRAKSIIIAAGSYTTKLTKQLGLNLPLRVERTHACYWKLDDPKTGSMKDGFPSFKCLWSTYGLAAHEYPGLVKICDHFGQVVDVDYPNVTPDLSNVTKFIKLYTKGVAHKPSIVEPCLYTITPDHDHIIDVHPKYSNIVIGAGFSGTGFKMAPVTGNILADLSLGKTPNYDIFQFRMTRFENVFDTKSQL